MLSDTAQKWEVSRNRYGRCIVPLYRTLKSDGDSGK